MYLLKILTHHYIRWKYDVSDETRNVDQIAG